MTTDDKPMYPSLTPMRDLSILLRKRREKGSVSHCKVCGKEDSRNDHRVNAKCPTHARAHAEKWADRVEKIEKILGETTLDLTRRGQFNAELTQLAQGLLKAREEHEAYVPEEKPADAKGKPASAPVKVNEPAVCMALREILGMLGAKADAENDPVKLCAYVKGNLALALNELRDLRKGVQMK